MPSNLTEVQQTVKRVIVSIHGLKRNARETFCIVNEAVGESNEILVISPLFTDEEISSTDWVSTAEPTERFSLFWASSTWMSGADNSGDVAFASSFDCLDLIKDTVLNKSVFPSVESVVFTGFSAGGQTLNRYSWSTNAGVDDNVRFVISNPGSLLYLNTMRPDEVCLSKNNTGPTWMCSSFVDRKTNHGDCSTFDKWKYGVSSYPKTGYKYLDRFVGDIENANRQTKLMQLKDIRYVLGDLDMCNCNAGGFVNDATCYHLDTLCTPSLFGDTCCDTFSDSTDNDLSNACEASIQGDRCVSSLIRSSP